jgi:uncharacterized protein (TIGR02246 family)
MNARDRGSPRDARSTTADAHVAIVCQLARYARALDDRDFDAVAACFTPDAQVTYDGVVLAPGREAIIAHVQVVRTLIASTHIVGQPVIELHGDEATVESSALAFLVTPGEPGPMVRTRGLRYTDRFVLDHGSWLIAERVHRVDWMYESPGVPPSLNR